MDQPAEELNSELIGGVNISDGPDEQFIKGLTSIYKQLRFGRNLKKSMRQVETPLLDLLDARVITIYQSVSNGKHVVATFKGGQSSVNHNLEIKAPFSPTSLAGYVALSQRPILVRNVRDEEELNAIHPRLQWDNS